jgi:hypothetical protein
LSERSDELLRLAERHEELKQTHSQTADELFTLRDTLQVKELELADVRNDLKETEQALETAKA